MELNLKTRTLQSQCEEAELAISEGDDAYGISILTPMEEYPPAGYLLAKVYYERQDYDLAEQYAGRVLSMMEPEREENSLMIPCLSILTGVCMSKKDYKQMEAHARKKISYIKDIHAADRMSVEFFKGYDDLLEALILQGEKQEAKVMIKSEVWEAFFLPDYAYNSFNEENILDKYFNLCSSAEEMEEFIADTAALLKGKADDEYVAGNIDKAYQKYGRVMHFILSAKENPDIHMSEFIPLIVECRIAQSKILEWKNESGAALKLLEETYRLVLIKIWRETPQTLEAVVYLSIRLADLYAICDDDKSAIIHYDTAVQLANLLNEKEQGMRFNAIIAQTQLKIDQMKKRDI